MRKKIRRKKNSSGTGICELCNEREYLEEHHINGRGNSYSELNWNKCDICPNCHTKVHRGDIIIEGWYDTTMGPELIYHLAGEKSITGTDAKVHLM